MLRYISIPSPASSSCAAPLISDLCVFKNEKTGVILILYVDDMLVAAPRDTEIDDVAEEIAKHFKIKKLGVPTKFLGFNILRDTAQKKIFPSQEEYINAMIEKYGFDDNKTAHTPWPSGNFTLPATWEPLVKETKAYQERTGALNWVSMGSRPDITYSVNKSAKGNVGPSLVHIQLHKQIFRYLKKYPDLTLVINGKIPVPRMLRCYADASHADDKLTRRATAGWVVIVAGLPTLWSSKLLSLLTLSTTESEFCNLTPPGKATLFVANFLRELDFDVEKPLILYTDSMNARHNVLTKTNSGRTRHIDIRYRWIQEQTEQGNFEILHVPTEKMAADGLTKGLERKKHEDFVKLLGLVLASIFRTGL